MVFAGTGHGFFYSRDDGKTWTQFKDKLPAAPVNWIEVPKNAAEVAVATYGRGLWILRDVWQLEQADKLEPAGRAAALQAAACGVRGRRRSADFVFALPAAPTSTITMDILDADGAVVSTSQVQGARGHEPATWNLLLPAPDQPVLRSIPPDNPHIWDAGRWQNRERPVTHWGLGSQRWQPRAAPGKYTRAPDLQRQAVHAAVRDLARRDCCPSTDADLVASTKLQREHHHDDQRGRRTRSTASRSCATQVEDLRKAARGRKAARRRRSPASTSGCTTPSCTSCRGPRCTATTSGTSRKYKLYLNLVWLLAEVGGGGGDVMGGVGLRADERGAQRVPGSAEGARDRAGGLRPADRRRRRVQQGQGGEDRGDLRSDADSALGRTAGAVTDSSLRR